MSTINERIKLVRKELGYSQDKFGKPLFLKKSGLSLIESGKNSATDQIISAICREYDVNETWLRTGEGEMFSDVDKEKMLAELTVMLLKHSDQEFVGRLISALSKLDIEQWELLANVADNMAKKE